MYAFTENDFASGAIKFVVYAKPVSAQNSGEKRRIFRDEIQQITKNSEFIITSTCWIAIDYYCQHIKRQKNPGVYDMDNIVKPILDALVGQNGLIIDDVIVDRVTVNWIDTLKYEHIEIEIEYPDLIFLRKSELVFFKSDSGWCFPSTRELIHNEHFLKLIKNYFDTWNSINSENEYYNVIGILPIQQFVYHVKVRDKGYTFVDL